MDNLSLLIIALTQLPKIWRAKINPFIEWTSFDFSLWVRKYLDFFNDNIVLWLVKGIKERFTPEILDWAYEKAKEIVSQSKEKWIWIANYKEDIFPKSLNDMVKDKPLLLYYIWDISKINEKRNITIIWSRNADNTWLTTSFYLWKQLASKWYNIVSWLAKWCDVEAHKWALSVNWLTTAIVWCWLDSITTNKDIAEKIKNSWGILLSEFLVWEIDTKRSLVERDRLQAWISDTIIWVQFSKESWTTHALNTALENKKKVLIVKYKNNNSELVSWNNYYLWNTDAIELTSQTVDLI